MELFEPALRAMVDVRDRPRDQLERVPEARRRGLPRAAARGALPGARGPARHGGLGRTRRPPASRRGSRPGTGSSRTQGSPLSRSGGAAIASVSSCLTGSARSATLRRDRRRRRDRHDRRSGVRRVRLTVVGAGPAYSDDPESAGACYLVRSGDHAIALDLGHGAFAGLAARFPPERLESVVISHLHPDHFVDLVPLRHYLRYHVEPAAAAARRRPPGPRRPPRRAPCGAGLHGGRPRRRGARARRVDARAVRARGERASPTRPTASRSGSRTGRAGRASSTRGTSASPPISPPLVRPGDTLLVEVSFGAGPVPDGASHLDGPAVGALAAATGAGTGPPDPPAHGPRPGRGGRSVRARFPGPVELVAPGFEAEI